MSLRYLEWLVLGLLILACLYLAAKAYCKEKGRFRSLFIILMASFCSLFMVLALELWLEGVEAKTIMGGLQLTLFCVISILFLLYDLEYAGKGKWVNLKTIALASAIPAIGMAFYWTNDHHQLFYNWIQLIPVEDTVEMYTDYSTVFFILYLFIRVLTVVGTLFVFYLFSSTPRTQKKQTGLVLIASCIPWTISTGEATFYLSESYVAYLINFSCLTLAGFLLYIGTFSFKHSDVTPLTYDEVVERMDDGVIIVDSDGALAYANSKARQVLDLDSAVIGHPADKELVPLELGSFNDGHVMSSQERTLKGRTFDVKTSRILGTGGGTQGVLVIIRDVTEELAAKNSLQLANDKLSLLAMVARHDMMNKLVVQRGYLELVGRDGSGNVLSEERRQRMLTNVGDMESIMLFTKDYQSLGLKHPEWQDLHLILQEAERTVHPPGIAVNIEVDGLEMFADGMLEKVFTNLIDNSLRHGEKVTTVHVHSVENSDHSLSIFYEDDGVGVPVKEKDLIFQLGHGRNTGLGMYLSRQILGITGASVTEKGRPGEGCTFEILVPSGKWRQGS